jgi:XTP/dITP diphosphohydrolase
METGGRGLNDNGPLRPTALFSRPSLQSLDLNLGSEAMNTSSRLLIATGNAGKLREYRALLDGLGWELVSPGEIGLAVEVSESGGDYAENAKIKAASFAEASGLVSLADDSGLEVDALGGEPGHLSARYAGPQADDTQRFSRLLERLRGVPLAKRGARFRCLIAVARPSGETELFEGECQGVVAEAPRGETGFGYDPIFYLPERGCTLAELSLSEKNAVSHRGAAARKARPFLEELLREYRD